MKLVCPDTGKETDELICGEHGLVSIPSNIVEIDKISREISMEEGNTPVFRSILVENLYFKDETRNPTGSFRDRAALYSVSSLVSEGTASFIVSGDGNTCASFAAYASRAKIKCEAVMPVDSDLVKVEQVRALGCSVVIEGDTLDETHKYAEQLSERKNVIHMRVDNNPYALYGFVKLGLELASTVDEKGIDAIIVPVGSGASLVGIYTGLFLAQKADEVRIIGVQAGDGAYSLMFSGSGSAASNVHYSLRYLHSPLLHAAYRATVATKGWGVGVPLSTVYSEAYEMSSKEGVFAEPAAVAGYIVAKRLSVERNWRTLVLVTSTGLKTVPVKRLFLGGTKIEILRLLEKKGRLHGYLIWKLLGERVSPQAVYSSLRWLEKRGFIASVEEGRFRYYYLTEKGRFVNSFIYYIFSRY